MNTASHSILFMLPWKFSPDILSRRNAHFDFHVTYVFCVCTKPFIQFIQHSSKNCDYFANRSLYFRFFFLDFLTNILFIFPKQISKIKRKAKEQNQRNLDPKIPTTFLIENNGHYITLPGARSQLQAPLLPDLHASEYYRIRVRLILKLKIKISWDSEYLRSYNLFTYNY